jgi:vitamin B12 transporter
LVLDINYTFTENKDQVELRIPKHKANLSLRYQALDNMQLVSSYQYTGTRNDLVSGNTVSLDSYQLWDLTARYSFPKTDLRLQLSLNNILDEHYEEISGFTTLGRNLRIGVELPF